MIFVYQKSNKKADILYQKGLTFYENKKFDLSIKSFNEALKENPNSANILNSKAIVLEKIQDNKNESMELYKKACELKPENALYLMNYSISLVENNYFDKCKEILSHINKNIENSISLINKKLNNLNKNQLYRPFKPKKN